MITKQTGFGGWVAERLGALGVTAEEFSRQASVSRAAVYFWLANRHPPTRTKRPALALLLGVSEAELSERIASTFPHGPKPSDGAGA